jgi:hypothetical protein
MDEVLQPRSGGPVLPFAECRPPAARCLGTVADVTSADKTVGGADGDTFLGIQIGRP